MHTNGIAIYRLNSNGLVGFAILDGEARRRGDCIGDCGWSRVVVVSTSTILKGC